MTTVPKMTSVLDDEGVVSDLSGGMETTDRDLEMKQFIKQFFDLPGLDDIIVNDVNLSSNVSESSRDHAPPLADSREDNGSNDHQAAPLLHELDTPADALSADINQSAIHAISTNSLMQQPPLKNSCYPQKENATRVCDGSGQLATGNSHGDSHLSQHVQSSAATCLAGANGAIKKYLSGPSQQSRTTQQLLRGSDYLAVKERQLHQDTGVTSVNNFILSNSGPKPPFLNQGWTPFQNGGHNGTSLAENCAGRQNTRPVPSMGSISTSSFLFKLIENDIARSGGSNLQSSSKEKGKIVSGGVPLDSEPSTNQRSRNAANCSLTLQPLPVAVSQRVFNHGVRAASPSAAPTPESASDIIRSPRLADSQNVNVTGHKPTPAKQQVVSSESISVRDDLKSVNLKLPSSVSVCVTPSILKSSSQQVVFHTDVRCTPTLVPPRNGRISDIGVDDISYPLCSRNQQLPAHADIGVTLTSLQQANQQVTSLPPANQKAASHTSMGIIPKPLPAANQHNASRVSVGMVPIQRQPSSHRMAARSDISSIPQSLLTSSQPATPFANRDVNLKSLSPASQPVLSHGSVGVILESWQSDNQQVVLQESASVISQSLTEASEHEVPDTGDGVIPKLFLPASQQVVSHAGDSVLPWPSPQNGHQVIPHGAEGVALPPTNQQMASHTGTGLTPQSLTPANQQVVPHGLELVNPKQLPPANQQVIPHAGDAVTPRSLPTACQQVVAHGDDGAHSKTMSVVNEQITSSTSAILTAQSVASTNQQLTSHPSIDGLTDKFPSSSQHMTDLTEASVTLEKSDSQPTSARTSLCIVSQPTIATLLQEAAVTIKGSNEGSVASGLKPVNLPEILVASAETKDKFSPPANQHEDSAKDVDVCEKAAPVKNDGDSDAEDDDSDCSDTSTDSSDFESISSLDGNDEGEDDSDIDDDDACIEGSDLTDIDDDDDDDDDVMAATETAKTEDCVVNENITPSVDVSSGEDVSTEIRKFRVLVTSSTTDVVEDVAKTQNSQIPASTSPIKHSSDTANDASTEPLYDKPSSKVDATCNENSPNLAPVQEPGHVEEEVVETEGAQPSHDKSLVDVIKTEHQDLKFPQNHQYQTLATLMGDDVTQEVDMNVSIYQYDTACDGVKDSALETDSVDGGVLPPHSDTMTVTLEHLARSIHFPYYYNLTMPWMPGGGSMATCTPPFWPPPPSQHQMSKAPLLSTGSTAPKPRFNTNAMLVASLAKHTDGDGKKKCTTEIQNQQSGDGGQKTSESASTTGVADPETKTAGLQAHNSVPVMPDIEAVSNPLKEKIVSSEEVEEDRDCDNLRNQPGSTASVKDEALDYSLPSAQQRRNNSGSKAAGLTSDIWEKIKQKQRRILESNDEKRRRKKKRLKEKWRREKRKLEEVRIGLHPKEKRARTSKHIVIYDEEGKRSWQCPECGKAFSAPGSCNRHIKTHSPQKRDWQCEECGKRFIRSSDLERHKRTHIEQKPISCTECGKGFSEACTLKVHMIRKHNAETPFKCEQCNKKFISKATYEAHMKVHLGVAPHQCNICHKAYVNSTTLRVHMRVHTGEKPYRCNVCNKSYAQSGYLRLHMMTHTGENPVACPVCNKGFKQTSSMKVHLRTHTGEKPYECKECGKRFRQSSDLRTHNVVHTQEKPFQCPICGRNFSRTVYRAHLRRHTQEKRFRCKICEKLLACSAGLEYHMRTHSGEMPFQCSLCLKAFKGQSGLTSHMRLHTGEKPFTCPVCQKCFTQSSSLKTHIKKQHGDMRPSITSGISHVITQLDAS